MTHCLNVKPRTSPPYFIKVIGSNIIKAIASLKNAMTNGGESHNRIKIAEVETDKTATITPR